ncbi:transcription antitermination factor NusB [Candidatus Saccharibacteria bacterium]|nr:transcription antitermination factor NusB [Candidatus Saccharibacteria bacterium]
MASNRHLGRILALQTLYEYDFRRDCGDDVVQLSDVLERNIHRYSKTIDDTQFVEDLAIGVDKVAGDLDKVLQPIAPEWPIDQIARIDRAVLRMSLYELLISKGIPPKVVINEAVELAKAFGSENSSRFINGVLGTLLRNLEEGKLKLPDSLTDRSSRQKENS